MKRDSIFNSLRQSARSESFPSVDVSESVMRAVSAEPEGRIFFYKPFVWVASMSSALAACVGAAAFILLKSYSSGVMSGLYETIAWAAN